MFSYFGTLGIKNFVIDGSFESGNLNAWTLGSYTDNPSLVSSSHSGLYSLKLANYGSVYQSVNLYSTSTGLTVNKIYKCSFYAKAAINIPQSFYLGINSGSDESVNENLTAPTNWTLFSRISSLKIPELGFYVYADGDNSVLFDDFVVQEVSAVNLPNSGFELGTLDGWTGGAAITNTVFRSGTYAARVPTGATIQRTISNLSSNTTYTFVIAACSENNTNQPFKLGASNFGGADFEITYPAYDNRWRMYQITFVTGTSSTSAIVYVTANAGTVCVDDTYLVKEL